MNIKALSLHQPWASLIAAGAKHIETRSWDTPYRGLLAIHATLESPRATLALANADPMRGALQAAGITTADRLPRGCILALCRLTACEPVSTPPPYPESAYGEYTPGRFAWRLDDIWALPEPLPARGSQGLWSVAIPDELIEERATALLRPRFGESAKL
jgi:hypothetical protein